MNDELGWTWKEAAVTWSWCCPGICLEELSQESRCSDPDSNPALSNSGVELCRYTILRGGYRIRWIIVTGSVWKCLWVQLGCCSANVADNGPKSNGSVRQGMNLVSCMDLKRGLSHYWKTQTGGVGLEVLTALVMKNYVSWNTRIAPCGPVEVNRRFGGDKFFRNVDRLSAGYTASHPRR
jgi:hypothetical protein